VCLEIKKPASKANGLFDARVAARGSRLV